MIRSWTKASAWMSRSSMIKHCVICGGAFCAPPSSKKVTCSKECRSKRAAASASRGHKWSSEAKQRRAKNPNVKRQMDALQSVGQAAAHALPGGRRGPQNRESKVWELVTPDGDHITVTNLLDWSRLNYTLFEPPCDNVDAAAIRVSTGFRAIASSMRGAKSRPRAVTTYKGWSLAKLPEKRR